MSGRKQNPQNNQEDIMKNVVNKYIQDKSQTNVNRQSPDYKQNTNQNDYFSQLQNLGNENEQDNGIPKPVGKLNDILKEPDLQDIFLKGPYEPKTKQVKEQLQDGRPAENNQPTRPAVSYTPEYLREEPQAMPKQPVQEESKRIPFQNVYNKEQPKQYEPAPNFFNTKDSYFQEEIRQTKNFQQEYTQRQNDFRGNEASFFFRDVDIITLPHGDFYHPNTRLQIRPVELREIQHIATLDNETIMEARNKINDLLNNCVNIVLPDGSAGSINNIIEGDRLYLILLLREITFQEGNMLSVTTKCVCDKTLKIELVRQHLEYHEISPEIEPFWDPNNNCFVFQTVIKRNPVYLAPPTIGIQTAFIEWAQYRAKKRLPINESFYKIVPFTKVNKSYMSIPEIENELVQFETNLSPELFSYLEDTVSNYMQFGIKGLVKKCSCGREVRTNRVFPRRAKDLFLVSGAFRKFTKKHS